MATVRFEHAEHVYPGAKRPAVSDLELAIEDGEFMVLVGPSGCGKSTLLRLLAGLEEPTAGTISIGGRDVTELPPRERVLALEDIPEWLSPLCAVVPAQLLAVGAAERRGLDVDRPVGLQKVTRTK